MKIKVFYIVVPVLLMVFGCKKFLNVTPINEAYEDEVFNSRAGFESALASVYVDLTGNTLYGKELKFGFLETMTGNYLDPGIGHTYTGSYNFDFQDPAAKRIISNIWGQLYLSINQVNIVLKNLPQISGDPYYNLIKGESLGLRTLAHFELLKYFGPVISQDGVDGLAIPYRDTLSFDASKPIKVKDLVAHLQKDLAEAKRLLENDPIRTGKRDDNNGAGSIQERYNSLMDRRGIRMNYYAVLSLQSLLAQWVGDQEQAGKYAEELISELKRTKSIHLAGLTDLDFTARNSDIRLAVENIFGLFDSGLRSAALFNFADLSDNRGLTDPLLYPNYTWLYSTLYNNPYHGTTNDVRLINWFGKDNVRWKFMKFKFNVEVDQSMQHVGIREVKIISLYNMYLVAAESLVEKNPQGALDYINAVRKARGIDRSIVLEESTTSQVLYDLIFDEFRKENIGEGTLFGEYKRKFKNIDRYNNANITASKEIFCFPIPDEEQIYNPF